MLPFKLHAVDPVEMFTPDRLDLIVKRRLFRHWLSGNSDPEAERLYMRHIAARAGATLPLHTYLPKAKALLASMQEQGFAGYPVPVNRNRSLLDGAHRTACASVLGVPMILAQLETDHRWPEWGREWFEANGLGDELPRILDDFADYTGGDCNAEAKISHG